MSEESEDIRVRSDEVRLSCVFIPDAESRAEVLTLFAFLETLRDIAERVSDALMGEIRLRWWYEAMDEIEAGGPVRYHPLTEALSALIRRHGFAVSDFHDLIEGQMPLLDKGPLSIKNALSVVDRGEGILIRLAARIVSAHDRPPDMPPADMTAIARLIGMAQIKATRGLSDAGDTELAHLRREAVKSVRGLPASLMPLALPAVVAVDHWQGRTVGPLRLRARLFWAYVSGKI
ncbi:MAG: squalene/phytoene synthase family protein [Asticcacaulis sp.]